MYCAEVAELADARGSGPRTRKGVGVRVPSSAPTYFQLLSVSRVRVALAIWQQAGRVPLASPVAIACLSAAWRLSTH